MKEIKIGKVRFSEKHLGVIAGPCVIESRDHALIMASEIKKIADKLDLPIIFKSSFIVLRTLKLRLLSLCVGNILN